MLPWGIVVVVMYKRKYKLKKTSTSWMVLILNLEQLAY